MVDTLKGLAYIHSLDIAHGDLKAVRDSTFLLHCCYWVRTFSKTSSSTNHLLLAWPTLDFQSVLLTPLQPVATRLARKDFVLRKSCKLKTTLRLPPLLVMSTHLHPCYIRSVILRAAITGDSTEPCRFLN